LLQAVLIIVLCLLQGNNVFASVDTGAEVNAQGDDPDTLGDNTDDHDEGHIHEVYAVLMPWFVQVVGIVVFYILTRHLHGVPYTAVLFVIGMLMGVGTVRGGFTDQLSQSIYLWQGINSEVLFCVFLPGLLFKDAIEVNFHLFQISFGQLLVMAFPMVLAGTLLTALVAMYVFPYGWSFHLALTFGSILAATDPVAVSALLNEVGAPPRLKMHVSGESLLNDGSAVVFYTVFSGLFLFELDIGLGEDYSVGEGFAIFFRKALGGAAMGLGFALGLVIILHRLDRRFEKEETVLQVAATVTVAYLSFYTAEVTAEMSGVISVVTCGIVTKAFGGSLISDWKVMDSFWSLLEHLLNTLIFSLGGVVFGFIIADQEAGHWEPRDWGYLVLLYLIMNVMRFFLLFAFYPILSRIGLKTCVNEVLFSGWAGLRGAVGIALALGLDNEVAEAVQGTDGTDKLEITKKVFGMVGGVAFLTLVINGTLSGPLLIKLGLADSTDSRKRIVECAEHSARQKVLDDFIHLMTDPRFFFIDFALVQHHCPILQNLTADELEEAVAQNKIKVHPNLYQTPNLEHVLPYIKESDKLKKLMLRAKRDLFMSGSATTTEASEDVAFRSFIKQMSKSGQQFLDEMEAAVEVPEEAPDVLVRDVRIMFVELLRAAYNTQIELGELDPREYNGFLSYSLLQGIDFAHDEAQKGKPLNDWALSQVTSNDYIDQTEDYFHRLYRCLTVKRGHPEERIHTLADADPLHYQQLRLVVIRAFSFMDAHRDAQDRLGDEFGSARGETAAAFRIVLEESKTQVSLAEKVLRSKTKKQLKNVISHYLCIVVQNKAARYFNRLVSSGVLLPREARHHLEEIDHEILHIRSCSIDEHPGTIKVADVVPEEEEIGGPRRRRRRIKQESIL